MRISRDQVSGPAFSVVIPAYNAPVTIASTIRSVLVQTRADLELIVVDDGSTDETPATVERFERQDSRVRLVRQANQGVAGARNTGIAQAQAPLVSFVDNDDLWLPMYLERMEEALAAQPEAGFAYTDGWTLDDSNKRIRKASTASPYLPPTPPPRERDAFLLELVRVNWILSSATVRKSVLDEVGGFDSSVKGVDDYDLWLRIVLAGYPGARTKGNLVIQRERSDSQSKDELMMRRALRATLQRVVNSERATAGAKASAAKQVAALDRYVWIHGGETAPARAVRALRRAATKLRGATRGAPDYYDETPPEIAQAFPDLREV
jgi:glycosyltransferase involved in cell wall biosynthesis